MSFGWIKMRKIDVFLLCVIITTLFTACGPKGSNALLDFQSSNNSNDIIYNHIEYSFYGFPEKPDHTEQVEVLNHDADDRIYTFKDYPIEEFIIEYYGSGEMDVPVLYRASNCTVDPENAMTYSAFSNMETMTIEDIQDSLDGNINISQMIVVGYYKNDDNN